jgi:diketogulonate reductase-like aldo/keto reductase
VTLPIPGTTSLTHLEENVAAFDLQLTDDELAALSAYRLTGLAAVRRRLRSALRPVLVPVARKLPVRRN